MANLVNPISTPLAWALAHLAVSVGSAGIAIILFTIMIRLVLSPLQIVQLRSARAMQRLQPHIADLRKKHGKDKQKLTEETMRLYKEHKVNPAMGCLPMLLQFPVLIGLFWALRDLGSTQLGKHGHAISPTAHNWLHTNYHQSLAVYQLFHAHFLWLSNGLGQHDPLYILPFLAGASQWIQSRMMMQKSSDPQQQTMNMMMNFTPLIIVFFAANYASGLSLYWVTSTIIGILVSIKITGWGSLPRVDRMIAARRAPAPGFVSSSSSRRPRPATKPARIAPSSDTNGNGNGNGVVDGGNILAGDESAPLLNGDVEPKTNVPSPKTNGRPPGRRRQGKPRGGRRG